MTNEEYQDFVLRYKGCGACFPMYHTLSRFEKMWFTAIQKDVAELESEVNRLEKRCANYEMTLSKMEKGICDICKETEKDDKIEVLEKKNTELKEFLKNIIRVTYGEGWNYRHPA